MSNVTSVSGTTSLDREDCQFEWKIQNSKFLMSESECLESPIFKAASGQEFYFKLIHDNLRFKSSRVLYLCCPNIKNRFKCIYKVSVDDAPPAESDRIFEANEEMTCHVLMPHYGVNFPFNNNAIVKCYLGLSRGIKRSFTESVSGVYRNKKLTSELDLNGFFLNETLSDFKLKFACGKEIPAHRVILAAASPVFNAMFSHDMLENKNRSVDIENISYDVAVEMLRYIYTGGVEEFSLTSELLVAADKYQLEKLKNTCDLKLASNLSTENTIKALKFANTYNAKYLKKRAIALCKCNLISLDDEKISSMLLSKELSVSE